MILIKKKKKNDFENIFKHLVFILRIKRRSSTKHYNNNNNNNNNRNKLKTNFHKVKLPNFKLIIRFKKKKGGGGGGGRGGDKKYKTKLHQSTALSCPSPRRISGAKYSGVPHRVYVFFSSFNKKKKK